MGDTRPRFKKLFVEITSACNRTCSFCPPTARLPAFLSVDQFRIIAAQAATLTQHLYLHVKGEPLLHPKLGDFLGVAHEVGLRVHLVTNGTLIDQVSSRILGHPALHQVNFSLHSFEDTQALVDDYLHPIVAFTRQASALGGTIVTLRFWRRPDPRIQTFFEREFPVALPPNTFYHYEQEFEWPSLDGPVRGLSGFCLGLRDQAAVLVDGTIVPCCLDGEGAVALGNVFTDGLTASLDSPRARALYQGFTEQTCVEPLCQRCGFRERFTP